jgi:hypothetical protein
MVLIISKSVKNILEKKQLKIEWLDATISSLGKFPR